MVAQHRVAKGAEGHQAGIVAFGDLDEDHRATLRPGRSLSARMFSALIFSALIFSALMFSALANLCWSTDAVDHSASESIGREQKASVRRIWTIRSVRMDRSFTLQVSRRGLRPGSTEKKVVRGPSGE